MRSKIISKNQSLTLGFRLGGISGKTVNALEDSVNTFNEFTKIKDLGVLILDYKVYEEIEQVVEDFKEKNSKPLIVILEEK